MKKRVPGLRDFVVKTVLMLAALSVSNLTLQASKEMDALLKVLVKRNVITEEDVIAIKSEVAAMVAKEAADTQATKPLAVASPHPGASGVTPAQENRIHIADTVDSLELYANARFRYHNQGLESTSGKSTHRSRPRYRLKFGAVTQFKDSPFLLGAQLETATSNDSNNADFGGFWDKKGGGINVGRLYFNYKIDDNTRVTFGKHGGIYTLPNMLWDGDLNPEGISETWKIGDVTFNAGQYLIDNENESRATPGDPKVDDDFMLMIQAILKSGDLTVSPIYMTSTSGQSTYPESGSFSGGNSQQYFRHFDLAVLPFEYKVSTGKIFGAIGKNFESKSLQSDPASPFHDSLMSGKDRGSLANLGYQHGSAKKEGQSQWSLEYRYIEGAAYSPNLSDSDWSQGLLNQAGFAFNYKYKITDFFEISGSYLEGSAIDATYSSPAANISESEILLIDAILSF